MTSLYEKFILPRMVKLVCSNKAIGRQREILIPRAKGVVLEIGVGPGLNLSFYNSEEVTSLIALDPIRESMAMGEQALSQAKFTTFILCGSAEQLPIADDTVDTVVATYCLCTIPDPVAALRELGRVLKPGGELLFSEHGLAPDHGVRKWQHRLNSPWRRFAGGCNLNRDIPSLIEESGFNISELDKGYISGLKVAMYNYRGAAKSLRP